MKKKIIELNLLLRKNGVRRARYLKKKNIFKFFGEHVYYHPTSIPSEPELVSIGNNVNIASNVRFITHDIFDYSWNYQSEKKYRKKFESVTLEDNVIIGADSIINYGVKIGRDTVVAAGSVVSKSFPGGVIIGGNPAKIIGKTSELKLKREIKSLSLEE
ncbi:acyltransferase [Candidatus Enterococcus ikei]|uniref:Acyltransferase n=1 Tax=Candidatus Enterococcus ikei TaxID=2815326 RepID=A0ABS3H117_9ENTE|nr:acyltransferase [Enterococcus sp. DIV0869a]MBO0440379.1 acyltransferase [Enterococcus sp. DIV0869a]